MWRTAAAARIWRLTRDGQILLREGCRSRSHGVHHKPDNDHFNRDSNRLARGHGICRLNHHGAVTLLTRKEAPVWDFRPANRRWSFVVFCRAERVVRPHLAMNVDGATNPLTPD